MKKTLLFSLIVIVFAVLLCGCGDKTPYSNYNLEDYITLGAFPNVEYDQEKLDSLTKEVYDALCEENKTTQEVTDRAVQDGDTVSIDYEGKIDGETFEGGSATGSSLEIGSGTFIPGFEDGLIGKNIGETVDLNLTFPETYDNNPDLAGKDVVFTVTINGITANLIPALEDLSEDVIKGAGFDSLDEYKKSVEKNQLKTLVWDNFLNTVKVKDYPDKELKNYYNNVVNYYSTMAIQNGMTLESFVLMYGGASSLDDFLGDTLDSASKTVKEEMTVYLLVNKNNIEISDEDYKTLGEEKATSSGYSSLEEYENNAGKDGVLQALYKDKLIQMIVDNAVAK